MPLEQITTTEIALANQVAQRMVQEELMIAKRREDIRANGIPAVSAQEALDMGDGRIRPAQLATPSVSADLINDALGVDNCAVFDSIKEVLGLP